MPGDLLIVSEGDRISADARLLEGSLEVDTSSINGESLPAYREASSAEQSGPLLEAPNLVFSGTSCTGGEARALAFATGMQTELGRIAALSQRTERESSPLELDVRQGGLDHRGRRDRDRRRLRAARDRSPASRWPARSRSRSGCCSGNVPEGLLPTITLALAIGVRRLASRGALVKRLSAVETLGSTTVICTDKTGTLTENRMQVTSIWTAAGSYDLDPQRGLADDAATPT